MRLRALMIAGFVALLSACASQPLRELLQLHELYPPEQPWHP